VGGHTQSQRLAMQVRRAGAAPEGDEGKPDR
jgi:hypothetical protein